MQFTPSIAITAVIIFIPLTLPVLPQFLSPSTYRNDLYEDILIGNGAADDAVPVLGVDGGLREGRRAVLRRITRRVSKSAGGFIKCRLNAPY